MFANRFDSQSPLFDFQKLRAVDMPSKKMTSSCGSVALALGLVLSTAPAYAAFLWTGSDSTVSLQAPAQDPFAATTPVIIGEPEGITPLIISGTDDPPVMQPPRLMAAPSIAKSAEAEKIPDPVLFPPLSEPSLAGGAVEKEQAPVVSLSSAPPSAVSLSKDAGKTEPAEAKLEILSQSPVGSVPVSAPIVSSPAPVAPPLPKEEPKEILAQEKAPIVAPEPAASLPPKEELKEALARETLPAASVAPIDPTPVAVVAPTSLVEPKKDAGVLETISEAPVVEAKPIVHGFASNVPLTLALRQVLPTGYTFSLSKGVDKNVLVSYKGGKPWDETLAVMLAPVGLDVSVQRTVVVLSRVAASAPVEAKASGPIVPAEAPSSVSIVKEKDATHEAVPAERSSIPSFTVSSKENESPRLVSKAPEVASISISSAEVWSVDRGDTLHKILMRWCDRAGVELKWVAEYDYPVEASARFTGGFEDAVRNLFSGFDGARPQPIGRLHLNPDAGQNVLVVETRGNSYSN